MLASATYAGRMVSFRPALPADADALVSMMRQLYSHESLRFREPVARRGIEQLVAEPRHGGIFLIFDAEQAVGYMVLTLCFSIEFEGEYLLVDELFVHEPYRGRGYGHAALAFADEFAREKRLNVVRLEVDRTNERAVALYRSMGFEVDNRHLMTRWIVP